MELTVRSIIGRQNFSSHKTDVAVLSSKTEPSPEVPLGKMVTVPI